MDFTLEPKAIPNAVAKLKFRTLAFIDGKFVKAPSGKTFPTENPATGKPLAPIAAGDAPDVDCAIKDLKGISLEGGGQSPQVVFADAPDLDVVARNAAGAASKAECNQLGAALRQCAQGME